MQIMEAEIKYFKKDGFQAVGNEGSRHVKVLPYLSIVQSLEGSYDVALGNGNIQKTRDGDFFIAPSGVQQTIVHHVNRESGRMTCRWIFVDVQVNKVSKLDSLYSFPLIVNNNRKEELNDLFDRLFATENIWENYGDCYKLLGVLVDISKPIPKAPQNRVESAVTYIREHYAEPITIKMLADISNMSESNFHVAFRKHIGSSPIVYLNCYRLSIAAGWLSDTNHAVNEISYSVGINDPLYFSKMFKKTYGMTPKEYRDAYRKTDDTQDRKR